MKSPRTEKIANNNIGDKKRKSVLEIIQNTDKVRFNCVADCTPKKTNKKFYAIEFIKDSHPDPSNILTKSIEIPV